jgi:MerR family transcriptional regulator/heat shock protein HspR
MNKTNASEEPVYIISVAAELAEVHPQTLRLYERRGLLSPARVHNRRRYSDADIERCKLIQELTQDMGVNLAGVKMVLDMRERLEGMRKRMRSMQEEVEELRQDIEERVEQVRESFRNDIVPVPHGELALMDMMNPFRNLHTLKSEEK